MSYNGWRNRETWLINVWFGDQWECPADVDACQEQTEEEFSNLPNWVQDFIDDSIIDWDGLREHAEEIEKEILENS